MGDGLLHGEEVYESQCGGGVGCGVPANEYSCAHHVTRSWLPLAALLVGDGLLHGEEVDDGAEGAEGQAHEADEAGHQQQGPLHRHRGQDKQARQEG